jgi:hypothetical protein
VVVVAIGINALGSREVLGTSHSQYKCDRTDVTPFAGPVPRRAGMGRGSVFGVHVTRKPAKALAPRWSSSLVIVAMAVTEAPPVAEAWRPD